MGDRALVAPAETGRARRGHGLKLPAPIDRTRPAPAALPLPHAVALGLLQGPAELLPISSSAHIALVPWLLRWRYGELAPELRKSFEVALHAGTAAALLLSLRREVAEVVRDLDHRGAVVLALSSAPPALAGYTLERPIEHRLGTPTTIAAGLLAGSAAMAIADLVGRTDRQREQAGAVDGLWLGFAQALALIPGVSRNGATLTAARARGFARGDANALSRHVALPVIVGAATLKAARLRGRDGLGSGFSVRLGAAALAAFASTLASRRLIGQIERDDRSLLPYAVYRALLATAVIRRLRQNGRDE